MEIFILTTIAGVGGIYYILYLLKTELPKRDERKKKELLKELAQVRAGKVEQENNTKEKFENKLEEIKKYEKSIIEERKEMQQDKDIYVNATEISKELNISARKLNDIFQSIGWAEHNNRWWIVTPAGEQNGGKQEYNTKNKQKYIVWNKNIINNEILLNAIKNINSETKISEVKINTPQAKKEKGDRYEEFVANHFREQGYYVWEHGKEKGVEDRNIDLFVKKAKEIYFVQCKDWEKWKIDHNKIKATRMDVQDFLNENPMLKEMISDFEWKVLYVTSKKSLTKGAYAYIQNNKDVVDHIVIPMDAE